MDEAKTALAEARRLNPRNSNITNRSLIAGPFTGYPTREGDGFEPRSLYVIREPTAG
jgi:hypothetical protein